MCNPRRVRALLFITFLLVINDLLGMVCAMQQSPIRWGPTLWSNIHRAAIRCRDTNPTTWRATFDTYMKSVPCATCRQEMHKLAVKTNMDQWVRVGQGSGPTLWTHFAHNEISRLLHKPTFPLWSTETNLLLDTGIRREVANRIMCKHMIVWGKNQELQALYYHYQHCLQ